MPRLLAYSILASVTVSVATGRPAFAGDQPVEPSAPQAAPADPPQPSNTEATPPAPLANAKVVAPTPPARTWRYTGMLGVIALPRLLSLELLAKYVRREEPRWDLAAFGLQVEYLPNGIATFGGKTSVSWLQLGVQGRYFVWKFLYVGAGVGWQFTQADSSNFGADVTYRTTSFYLAPKVGALYTFASGLTIGGDLGATIPFAYKTTQDPLDTSDSNARAVSKTFGMFVMPFASLFRVGYTY